MANILFSDTHNNHPTTEKQKKCSLEQFAFALFGPP
jgi:hypothetical protein